MNMYKYFNLFTKVQYVIITKYEHSSLWTTLTTLVRESKAGKNVVPSIDYLKY